MNDYLKWLQEASSQNKKLPSELIKFILNKTSYGKTLSNQPKNLNEINKENDNFWKDVYSKNDWGVEPESISFSKKMNLFKICYYIGGDAAFYSFKTNLIYDLSHETGHFINYKGGKPGPYEYKKWIQLVKNGKGDAHNAS